MLKRNAFNRNNRCLHPTKIQFINQQLKNHFPIFTEVELESIQERYIQVLRCYLQHASPNNPGRLSELLAHIPEVSIFLPPPLNRHHHQKEKTKTKFFSHFSISHPTKKQQIQAAASLLLESKMFYVPFVLNSASVS